MTAEYNDEAAKQKEIALAGNAGALARLLRK
jgi:hypothetical protein